MTSTQSKTLVPNAARAGPAEPPPWPESESSDAEACAEVFTEALAGLPPVELRVLYLTMSRAAELNALGRSADAEALLLQVLRILD
jgi:hypothetical protein